MKIKTIYIIGLIVGLVSLVFWGIEFYKVSVMLMNPEIINIKGVEFPLYKHPYYLLPSGFSLVFSSFLIMFSIMNLSLLKKQEVLEDE